MGLLTPRKSPLVGVDISSTSVKLIQLSQSGDTYQVDCYAVEPLPVNAVVEKRIIEVDRVGQAIADALKRSGSKCKHAASAVSGSSVITRIVSTSSELSGDELENQIQVEATDYIPYPIDEVSFDYEVIGPAPDNPNMINILLAASRTENVDMRVAALDLAGLTAKVIDVEAFALENAFSLIADQFELGHEALVALIDLGATVTTLLVLRKQHIIYSREQIFGGQQLIDEIMRRYTLSHEEAVRARRNGDLPESFVNEILVPFRKSLVQQINLLMQFFYAGSEYSRIDQIVLVGDYATLEGIDSLLEEQFGVACVVANPLMRMAMSTQVKAQELVADSPSLMIALGLAMRSFDR